MSKIRNWLGRTMHQHDWPPCSHLRGDYLDYLEISEHLWTCHMWLCAKNTVWNTYATKPSVCVCVCVWARSRKILMKMELVVLGWWGRRCFCFILCFWKAVSKKNKIPRNKPSQGCKRPILGKLEDIEQRPEEDKNKWKHTPFSWIGRISIIKTSILHKAIYRLMQFLLRFQWSISQNYTNSSKIYGTPKGPA